MEVSAAPPLGPFLLAIVVCSFSFLGLTISSLILTVSFVPTHWSMKVIWTCSLLALARRRDNNRRRSLRSRHVPTHPPRIEQVASGIFLVEPRPSHWLATFGQVRHFLWRASGGELRRRLRRWWRWRKKYAMKTKLNV